MKKRISIILISVFFLSIVIIGTIYLYNKTYTSNEKTTDKKQYLSDENLTQLDFNKIYGYCPNNTYIGIAPTIIKSKSELEEKLIAQLENEKNVIYVNEEWKRSPFLTEEWERKDDSIKKNKTVEEYFDEEFFNEYNIGVFSYSLYNESIYVKSVMTDGKKAYIELKHENLYNANFDASVGYCFIILDKNISEYEFVET